MREILDYFNSKKDTAKIAISPKALESVKNFVDSADLAKQFGTHQTEILKSVKELVNSYHTQNDMSKISTKNF
jgi:hypothetical protein